MPLFFAIAFGVAWACQIPVYALGLDGPAAYGLLALGAVAPSAAALIVTRGAVWRDLVRGPRPTWALVVGLLGSTVLIAVAGLTTHSLVLGAPYLGSVLVPPIGEELGWRGYLQPRLRSSLFVGAIWALWHLPTAFGHFETFPLFAASVVGNSILISWLYERSGGSILACVAAHTGINLGLVHATRPGATLIVLWIAALVVVFSSDKWRRRASSLAS
jgi:membrane protease YdiL (CAAX protease family)